MKHSAPLHGGFKRVEACVLIVVVAVLGFVFIPRLATSLVQGHKTQTLNNVKQIHLVIVRMSLDNSVAPDPKIGWPGEMLDIKDMGDFVERVVEYKYFERGDLKEVFRWPERRVGFFESLFGKEKKPGLRPYTGVGPFRSENSPFKIYRVTKEDDVKVILVATKNFTFGKPLDAEAEPFGKVGAVIFRKSGEGLKISDEQATQSADGSIGYGVGGISPENPGTEGTPLL